jgi:hypothetical protein
MSTRWYEHVYRRNVIDMHIADWDERFLSQFDPVRYVEMLRLCRAQSAVVYAHSHVGHCYYPTRVGHMHRGLKGRNILAEVLDQCQQHGICAVVYYSLIFDDWAYRHHPEWRIILANGEGAAEHSRYGVCCPNSPYRDYARAHAEEICRLFEFQGMRFDMTFWPAVCYCVHCQQRFAEEVGGELPRVVDWGDGRWVAFQRRREAWLAQFAADMTRAVRRIRPEVTVEHQASTYPLGWRFGVTTALVKHNDFLQGDFYGDALQGSFVRKLFRNLSPSRPFGFETSSSVNLSNHTATKSAELLSTKAHACIADGGAFVFIDAIDPVGTLNPAVYERMGKVFSETKDYEPFLGGELCQDVGVYLSMESKYDPADSGKAVDDPQLSSRVPHVEAVVGACKALIEAHIPYGVITQQNLRELARHKALVLPDVKMIDAEEVEAFREYVRRGGNLYASAMGSLVTKDGQHHEDLLLGDVLGVSYAGKTEESFTYIASAEGAEGLLPGYSPKYPLGVPEAQAVVRVRPGAEVLGWTALPYTNPSDPTRYASIHSNPPGIPTRNPAVVLNHFGKGRALYVTASLESHETCRDTLVALLRYLGELFSVEAAAPKAVEVTTFHQADRRRFVVNLLNFQKELPNIPVEGVRIRLRLNGSTVRRVVQLPAGTPIGYEERDGCLEFAVPRLETLAMIAVDYA